MVISQPQGIILHIIIVLHQRCLNCSECFQRHLMFYTCNYNIRVTHRNGAIKHVFYTNQIHGGIINLNCSLFILSLHALALHLAVKILLQIFLWRFEALNATYICRLYFPSRMPAGPHFVAQPILMKTFLIFDINHQQNTKVRPDWNDKNDNANYAPSSHGSFTNGSSCIFKEIFDQVRKDLDWQIVYSELKRHNVSHYIYYHTNVFILMKTITPC